MQSSLTGDAYKLVSKLSLTDGNYETALVILSDQYLQSDRIEYKLLSMVTRFSFPRPNGDYSNFTSAMVSLQVFLQELKSEHALDLTEGAAERLVRQIVHEGMPAVILDEYRNVLNKSYPTL